MVRVLVYTARASRGLESVRRFLSCSLLDVAHGMMQVAKDAAVYARIVYEYDALVKELDEVKRTTAEAQEVLYTVKAVLTAKAKSVHDLLALAGKHIKTSEVDKNTLTGKLAKLKTCREAEKILRVDVEPFTTAYICEG